MFVATNYPANYGNAAPLRVIVSAFLESNDVDSFIKLVHAVIRGRDDQRVVGEAEDSSFDNREYVGRILFSIIGKKATFNLTELLQVCIFSFINCLYLMFT